MALHRRALLVALATVLGGCTGTGTPTESPTNTEATATATPSDTATATEPGYLACDGVTISKALPEAATAIPDSLDEERVREYATRLEEYITLPLKDGEPDGYLSIGTVEVEPVEYGSLATVPVTGGYYNYEQDDSTETVHADLAPYTATYFVSERLVRRAEDSSGELDPRDYGAVVVCESD